MNVRQLFIVEGAILGMIGGLTGLLLGSLITGFVGKIGIPMPPAPGFTVTWLCEPKVVPSVLAGAFALSVFTSILSALLPAAKASRMEIAQALRYSA